MCTEPTGSGLHILVVDDEPVVLDVLAACLSEDGHVVETASGGSEAWDRFRTGNWDVVFTDRVMPGMSGDQLATAIKQASPETPVIMVTGFVPPEDEGRRSPVDVVVRKPFTTDQLLNAIDEARALCWEAKLHGT
jgi:CheY-like chemotaxis protein